VQAQKQLMQNSVKAAPMRKSSSKVAKRTQSSLARYQLKSGPKLALEQSERKKRKEGQKDC
jgi:hypothetical protein